MSQQNSASNHTVPSLWSQKSTKDLKQVNSCLHRPRIRGQNEVKKKVVRCWGYLSVEYASTVWPPQNNVLLTVLPHKLIQTPVASFYGYLAKLNKQCLTLEILHILCSARSLQTCFTESEVSVSHQKNKQTKGKTLNCQIGFHKLIFFLMTKHLWFTVNPINYGTKQSV